MNFASRGNTRTVVLLVLVVALVAAILVGQWYSDRLGGSDDFDDALLVPEPATLAPRLHVLGGLSPSVVYVVETTDGLVLIDAGLEPDAASLLEQLRVLGLDGNDVAAILLTHAHGDHAQGARYLRGMTGAKIYAGDADASTLRDGGPREAIFSTFPMDGFTIHGTPVDVELQGGEKLRFGNAEITVIATPGHTPGSICYLLKLDGRRILFGGDTISSLVGDLGTYSAYLPPRYRGNARDYLESLRKLQQLPKPDLVLPGHPNGEGRPYSPRMNDAEWQALLSRGIEDMARLVTRYENDGADFLDGTPKQILPGLWYLGDHQGRAVYFGQAVDRQLLLSAHGDDGLPDFVSRRLNDFGVNDVNVTEVLLTSGATDITGGLEAVVRRWPCRVVADESVHASLTKRLPHAAEVLTLAEWIAESPVDAEALTFPEVGEGAVVYVMNWQGRRVLVSSGFPSTWKRNVLSELQREWQAANSPQPFLRALDDLRKVQPQVWLPARPKHGQNANIYDDQWDRVLAAHWSRGN